MYDYWGTSLILTLAEFEPTYDAGLIIYWIENLFFGMKFKKYRINKNYFRFVIYSERNIKIDILHLLSICFYFFFKKITWQLFTNDITMMKYNK